MDVDEAVMFDAPTRDEPWIAHPTHPEVWLSAVDQPCDTCGRVTRWRSVRADGKRFRFGHAYTCSERCLFMLKLEGLLE